MSEKKADEFIAICVQGAEHEGHHPRYRGCVDCPAHDVCMAVDLDNTPDRLCDVGRVYLAWEKLRPVTHHWVSYYGGADHLAAVSEVPNGKTLCGRPIQHHENWPLSGVPPVGGTCVLCREEWEKATNAREAR